MRANVFVTLRAGILDPQGKAIEGALKSLGVDGITSARQGKVYELFLADGTEAADLDRACKSLVNPVMEDYQVEIVE